MHFFSGSQHCTNMATRTSSGTVDRIREELICAVCLDILSEPKVLQCAHSFCRECLEKIVAQHQQPPAPNYTAGPEDEGDDQGLKCPSCRKVTHLPEGGVSKLNTNCHLKRLAEIISDEDKQRMRDELQKRKTSVPVVDRERLPLCDIHTDKHLEYFCMKCSKFLCPMCLIDRHKDHDYKDLQVFLSEQLTELRNLIQPACEVTSLADSLMEKLSEDQEAISKNRDDSIEAIQDSFKRMHEVLVKRERALLSTVREYSASKLTRTEHNEQELRSNKESIERTVNKIENLLQQSLEVSILAERHAVVKSLSKLRESTMQLREKVEQSSSFLMFKPDNSLEQPLSDLGTLSDCRYHPDSTLLSVNPVLVTDDEERSHYAYYKRDVQQFRQPKPILPDDTVRESLQAKPFQPNPGSPVYVQKSPRPQRASSECIYEKLGEYIPIVPVPSTKPVPPPPLPQRQPPSDQDHDATPEPEKVTPLPSANPKLPPPLPPNHPPSDQDRGATPQPENRDGRRRTSRTLPNLNQTPQIIQPVVILDMKQFSSPCNQETVHPCGVCCTGIHDTLVITDVHNHCVRLITSDGKFIQKFGDEGTRNGQLKKPRAIAVSADSEYVYVAERGNRRIQKLKLNGGKYALKLTQKMGHQLEDPWGIAVLPDGSAYVSDWARNKILVYSGSDGRQTKTIGGDFLMKPAGIAFDKHHRLIVADQGSHCVWVLSADGSVLNKIGCKSTNLSLTRLTQSGVEPHSKRKPQSGSEEPGQLRNPYGIACSEDGSIIVTESGNDRISIFSSEGEFIRFFGRSGSEPGRFNHPSHVCINSEGQLLVVDEVNYRIQVFEL